MEARMRVHAADKEPCENGEVLKCAVCVNGRMMAKIITTQILFAVAQTAT